MRKLVLAFSFAAATLLLAAPAAEACGGYSGHGYGGGYDYGYRTWGYRSSFYDGPYSSAYGRPHLGRHYYGGYGGYGGGCP